MITALLWGATTALLLRIFALVAAYVLAVIPYKFGLDFSEGLIWQQAAWVPGPHMYGDITQPPFVGFEYPPLYHMTIRLLAALTGLDLLQAGRSTAAASSLLVAILIGASVRELCRSAGGLASRAAPIIAGLLPAAFLPILAWAPLMRVDMMAAAFTYAGILLGLIALRRPASLYPALLCFVAACYTKQTFLAAPAAMLAIHALRDPRHAARAGAGGLAAGLAILAILSWWTRGGFLRHILGYNVNRFSLATALHQIGLWLLAYALAGLLVTLSGALAWRHVFRLAAPQGLWRTLRRDASASATAFLTLYLALCTAMLLFAGKTGASLNYFIEFFCLWCVWIGLLAARSLQSLPASGPLPACAAAILLVQLWTIPGQVQRLHAEQLSPKRTQTLQALLARVRAMNGPVLSDDMVLLKRAGKDVSLEPDIIAELSYRGLWDENRLITMLKTHHFAAIVTAYGPGDPTFDGRYLPQTQAALLAAYPHTEKFGDYVLRLPGG